MGWKNWSTPCAGRLGAWIALVLVLGCGGGEEPSDTSDGADDGAGDGDAGAEEADAGEEAGPADDGGAEAESDDGGAGDGDADDAGASDGDADDGGEADGGSDYRVLAGDCVLLWVRDDGTDSAPLGLPATFRDADGDGRRDVLTGGRGLDAYHGRVVVRGGRDGALLAEFEVEGTLDRAPATIADVDGDGIEDILLRRSLWAPGSLDDPMVSPAPGSRSPAVSIHSGTDGTLLWQRVHAAAVGQDGVMGEATQGPDVSGDGVGDILVGVPSLFPGPPEDGRLLVLDGRTGAELASHAGPAGVHFPAEIFSLGDVDGDGRNDLAAGGSPVESPLELHVVVALPLGSRTALWRFTDELDDFSNAKGTLDANGDGALDVVVNLRERWIGEAQGVVLTLDGRSGAEIWRTEARTAINGHWGVGLAVTADADGDGTLDVAAGTSHSLPNIPTTGAPGQFCVVSGADGSYLAEVVHEIDPDTVCDFGMHIAAFDDPTDRGGAAIAVTDDHGSAGRRRALTGWSCRAAGD
jgi:outer membrane protein assembly factor BamB